jgi:hypothetical protein
MAIAILSQPDFLKPAYSTQEFTLYDSELVGVEGLYYQLDISIYYERLDIGIVRTYVGDRYLKTLPDQNGQAVIDVQTILQSFFESQILTHTSITQDYSTGLYTYDVKAHSIIDSSDYSTSATGFYVFNGVDLYNKSFDPSTYQYYADPDPSSMHLIEYLTNYTGPREVHLTDDLYFQQFYILGIPYCGIEWLNITRFQKDGSVSSRIFDLNSTWPNPAGIQSINAGPKAINLEVPGFINSDTLYYIANGTDSGTQLEGISYRINVIPKNPKFRDTYRIYWVNQLGATEAFNFDLVPTNTISISKTLYTNDREKKIFGTQVDDNYVVTSNWITEEQSEALKSLWHSPLVKLYLNGEWIPIIINESSKQISNKWNTGGLINYTLSFTYALEYAIQSQ